MIYKREMVLTELNPIASVLGIELDYIIEENREYLCCNGQKICCNCTGICGIRQEFFGYVFLREWRDRYIGAFDKQTRNYIKQYWYDDNFNQPYLRW